MEVESITIKELRKQKAVSPAHMADYLQIALSTYFDKEAGRRRFNPPEIVKICSMFKVRVEDVDDFKGRNTRIADAK